MFGRNLIPDTKFSDMGSMRNYDWVTWGAAQSIRKPVGSNYIEPMATSSSGSTSATMGVQSPILTMDLVEGEAVTITFKSFSSLSDMAVFDYTYLINVDGSDNQGLSDFVGVDTGETINGYKVREYSKTVVPNFSGRARVLFGQYIDPGTTRIFAVSEPKLTISDEQSPYASAPEDSNWSESTVTTPVPLIKLDDYISRGVTGAGVKVGIVDDGIMDGHPALEVAGGYACGHRTTYHTKIEHGNHCAGIVSARHISNGEPHGIAPQSSLYAIRMAYRTAEERVQSVIDAIDFAIEEGIDILSMSIHLISNAFLWTPDNTSTGSHGVPKHMRLKMRDAFVRAVENDVICVVAAGNNNDGSGKANIESMEHLPKMPGVVTVANFTEHGEREHRSGVGSFVDVAGYGFRIRSTIPRDKSYGALTGTSMATPMIAGIVALYIQLFRNDGFSNYEVLEKMYENCQLLEDVPIVQQGRGVPQPPQELYDISIMEGYQPPLRMRFYERWQAVTPYDRVNNDWKELEVMVNE